MSHQSPKNISSEPPRIQHEIYSASDWLRALTENLWQIRTTSRKSGREGCEAPEPPLPLHPRPPLSCDLLYPKWEAINKESNFVFLPSAHYVPRCKSLAPRPELSKHDVWCIFPCTNSLKLLNLASHPSDLLNRQNQCSKYGSAPLFVLQTVRITFGNQWTVLR